MAGTFERQPGSLIDFATNAFYNGDITAADCSMTVANADRIGWYTRNSGSDIQPVAQILEAPAAELLTHPDLAALYLGGRPDRTRT